MDPESATPRQPAPAPGGSVEPANRAAVAKERFQTPHDIGGERYELRDPLAELTYRAKTLPEMIAKAEQLAAADLWLWPKTASAHRCRRSTALGSAASSGQRRPHGR